MGAMSLGSVRASRQKVSGFWEPVRVSSTLTPFPNAQRSLMLSESEFTRSNLMLATDLISLYKALGGGW
jgi:hypothetical protein